MKYILKFIFIVLLYIVNIWLYSLIYIFLVLWHFHLNPPYPKSPECTYKTNDWRFKNEIKWVSKNITNLKSLQFIY